MEIKAMKMRSMMTESRMEAWRKRGRVEKRKVRILSAGVFLPAAVALVFLSITPAFSAAQDQPTGQQGTAPQEGMRRRRGNELDWLSRTLNLTDQQKAQIKPILEDQHKQMMSLRQDTSLSPQEKRAKFMEIRSKTLDKIRPILTEEQRATLEQMQKRREERMRAWRERHQGSQASPAPQSQ
jgi:Spy/CpxP family protein refolding chaperone